MRIITMAYSPKSVIDYLSQKHLEDNNFVCRALDTKPETIKLFVAKTQAELHIFVTEAEIKASPIVDIRKAISNHYLEFNIPYKNATI